MSGKPSGVTMNKVYDLLRDLTVPQLFDALFHARMANLMMLEYQIEYTLYRKSLGEW